MWVVWGVNVVSRVTRDPLSERWLTEGSWNEMAQWRSYGPFAGLESSSSRELAVVGAWEHGQNLLRELAGQLLKYLLQQVLLCSCAMVSHDWI